MIAIPILFCIAALYALLTVQHPVTRRARAYRRLRRDIQRSRCARRIVVVRR